MTKSDKFTNLRKQAEEMLQQPDERPELSLEQAQHLLHELQVYQIELEMQNEELRRTQQQLSESRDRYADLYDLAPVGYFAVSEKGLILEANLAGADLLGVERSALIGQPLSRFMAWDSKDQLYLHYRQVFESKIRQLCELEVLKKDGRQFYVQLESVVTADRGGDCGGQQCRTVISDIAERKQAEESLRESEERYRQVITSISDHIYTTEMTEDGEQINLYISPNIEGLTGYPAEKFKTDWSFWPSTVIHPDDREAALRQMERLTMGQDSEMEYRLVQADGNVIWIRDSGKVKAEGNSKIIYGVVSDITERRRMEEALRQQERLAAVGQLAAGITHDFNNILTSIIGLAELNRIQPGIPASTGRDLERIVQQGRRAAHLVRQILDFSRKSVLQKRPLELISFVEETIKLLKRTIPEDIRIIVEIEPGRETPMFNADPTQVQQMLTNLAVNARDAMPEGGSLQFRLSTLRLKPGQPLPSPVFEASAGDKQNSIGSWIVLSVSDSGHGITPELLPRIFEPFFTTKEVGQGSGLGLAQVYGIVKQHEGYIDVASRVGQGTTFTIYLPALSSLPEALPESQVEIPRGSGEVILLVEDEPVVLESVQAMLESLNYRVLTATDGRQALEVYDRRQEEIALVLTDMVMPEIGGLALSQALHQRNPALKMVVLTGYPMEVEAEELLALGIVDWVRKPLRIKRLAQAVNKALKLADEAGQPYAIAAAKREAETARD